MKIKDKIYIPHICPTCNTARLILRDDLHDHPTIICTECGGAMQRWVTYKEAPQPYFSDEVFDYLTYTQKLREITGSPWDRNSGFSLADVRKKVGQDLVHDPGLPEMIFTKPAVEAAELRAELMVEKIEDIVVTLVCEVSYNTGGKSLRVESVPHSQLYGRIQELHDTVVDGKVRVWIAYSEETSQVFVLNGLEIDEPPWLPRYEQEYEHKRKGYRTTTDGVI